MHEFGDYRIDGLLGSGAVGQVYKAFDRQLGRFVALKIIREESLIHGRRDEYPPIARFRNEVTVAGRLSHPNIVAVVDYAEHGEKPFIAMELVDGAPLRALLVPGIPVGVDEAMAWMRQLLLALAYAHGRGVVHLDIKPANLLITADAQLRVTDFGIARIACSVPDGRGAVVGTPGYMSPEQFHGGEMDGRADMFSAAIVLYQMLTGTRPFAGTSVDVMLQILHKMPDPPSTRQSSLGRAFDSVILRALAKNPVDRYDSALLFLEALEQAYRQSESRGNVSYKRDQSGHSGVAQHDIPQADFHTTWKLTALPVLELALSIQIGPVARALLRRSATHAGDIDTLCTHLQQLIPSEKGRDQFNEIVRLLKTQFGSDA